MVGGGGRRLEAYVRVHVCATATCRARPDGVVVGGILLERGVVAQVVVGLVACLPLGASIAVSQQVLLLLRVAPSATSAASAAGECSPGWVRRLLGRGGGGDAHRRRGGVRGRSNTNSVIRSAVVPELS